MGIKSGKTGEFRSRPFEQLKKRIKQSEARAPSPPPPLPGTPADDDLFADAMSDVHAIGEFRHLPCDNTSRREAPQRSGREPDAEALDLLAQIASGERPLTLSHTQEYVEWTNPDFRPGLVEELHTGRFSVQGMLDLHGFTGDAVNGELDDFLSHAFRRGWRCVKIIHGRGLRSVKGPVLKNAVIKRLAGKYRDQVIAFVSARQCDGGLGALYVLLGRK